MYVHKCLGRYFMTEPSNLFDFFLNCIFNREIFHTRANVKNHILTVDVSLRRRREILHFEIILLSHRSIF